jgi:ferredoxin-NADP reductase
MTHTVRILSVAEVTHDVRRLTVEKPKGFQFVPGQATEVAIDDDRWGEERRPFTFTSLNPWPELEFTIKIYPDHGGVTEQIGKLEAGDRLLIDEPWGAIRYRGKGCFIAGGAGVTPFIAIIRDLEQKGELAGNMLIFSNKTERDIILRSEFEAADGLRCLFTVTDEPGSPLALGVIDKAFLQKHVGEFDQKFYVCGPPKMVEDISRHLEDLGAAPDAITFEE